MIHPIKGACKVAKATGHEHGGARLSNRDLAGPSGEISILDGGLPQVAGPSIIRLAKRRDFFSILHVQ